MTCRCAETFSVRLGRPHDRREFKRLMDRVRFPTFLGPRVIEGNAVNGGLNFYEYGATACAATLVNPRLSVLLALGVVPEHRRHGLGAAVVAYLRPNFARVIEGRDEWFR